MTNRDLNRLKVVLAEKKRTNPLAGGLTEEDIRNGKTYQRNPYMATFATNSLHYRGIGSGIVRILSEYPDIQIHNDDSAKEFKVIIWRTIQKENIAIQKEENTIQKKENTIQKKENTIQKKLGANDEKILNYLKTHPKSTIGEIVRGIDGISLGGVKFVIGKLQKEGLLKRVGGRKFGEWQVINL